jgi:hypothetical protein
MSSVKRRKVGGDVPAGIQRKASSDLASAASTSPDPEMSNPASENKAEGPEAPKTFKGLVCNLEKFKFEYNH